MTEKQTPQKFLSLLKRGIRNVLADKSAQPADKLKAIEVGAKLAAIEYKIKGGGDDDQFFN